MEDPLAVRVAGRSGAGRRTVAQALRCAGVAVTEPGAGAGADVDADVDVYVFVEALNNDDRAELAAGSRPTVAVLNKIDLAGFAGGELQLRREVGVPVRGFSALLAVAGTDPGVLDDATFDALRKVASGARLDEGARRRLAAHLDVVGTALAVAALREGAGRTAVAETLCRFSGIGDVLVEIDRAGAQLRYRRAVGPARRAAAVAVLEAAGVPALVAANPLAVAIHWNRYARGPVSLLHHACAMDAARAALQVWVRAGGRP